MSQTSAFSNNQCRRELSLARLGYRSSAYCFQSLGRLRSKHVTAEDENSRENWLVARPTQRLLIMPDVAGAEVFLVGAEGASNRPEGLPWTDETRGFECRHNKYHGAAASCIPQVRSNCVEVSLECTTCGSKLEVERGDERIKTAT